MNKYEDTKSVADDFVSILHDIYGFYADTTLSYSHFLKWFTSDQIRSAKTHKTTIGKIDQATMTYANGDPTDPNAVILHECTQEELKKRNTKNGKNTNYISQFCTAMLYEYWENHFRSLFAKAVGIKKNDLKSDIFGDIRLIRHDILHARGTATKNNSGKTIILKWFKDGDAIFITEDMFQELLVEIFKYINSFIMSHYKIEAYPDHSLSLKGRARHRSVAHIIKQ